MAWTQLYVRPSRPVDSDLLKELDERFCVMGASFADHSFATADPAPEPDGTYQVVVRDYGLIEHVKLTLELRGFAIEHEIVHPDGV